MREERRLVRGFLAMFVVFSVALAGAMAQGAEGSYRLDCGTADSPIMEGYQRLTGEDVYAAEKGYGWEGTAPKGTVYGPPVGLGQFGQRWEPEYIRQNATDLTCDGIVSGEDLTFRADVPDGAYRVTVVIGDLSQAIGSMDVWVNGELAEGRVAAWLPAVYRGLHKTPTGWWTYVRDTVAAEDGVIRITLKENQSYYDEQMAEQSEWETPYKAWRESYEKNPPYFYIGYPFVHNSIMGIEVVPHVPAPLTGEDDNLRMRVRVGARALNDALSEFNEGNYEASLAALDRVRERDAEVVKAIVQLWLAGRLEVEEEKTLVPEAIEVLKKYAAEHPEQTGVAELVGDAEIFWQGLTTHLTRGELSVVEGRGVQKNHFIENDKAFGWLWMIKEGSPLYYKAQLYAARAAHMLVPYIPTLGTEGEILKKLEKKFPDNRHVKYLLHWEWQPYGDGTKPEDWYKVDYLARSEGAPEWARQVQAAWANLIDWSEWWIKFKQRPEGNIGGGWGDDVEIVGAFGYFGGISRGVSDLAVGGAAKLVEGVWNLSEVDPEIGYCLPMADAEHTAEWTGNTLGMMVQIDYGNPVWIERSMKTGQLMRDLWTDYDANGQRHFRANFFGAAQVGSGDQRNDSWINLRALGPATAILNYNQNPTLSKLYVELADGWLAAALSTERGKPRGVIPAEVSFPEGIIGGINSANWWTASHPKGTVNHDWAKQSYKNYMQDLLVLAYEQTGDTKYLEPLRLEYELAAKYGKVAELKKNARLANRPWVRAKHEARDGYNLVVATPEFEEAVKKYDKRMEGSAPKAESKGKEEQVKSSAEAGSEEWAAERMSGVERWLVAKRMLEGREGEPESDITKEEMTLHMTYFNLMMDMRWPQMTTEASATDRAAFIGFPTPFMLYTGGRFGGPLLEWSITYENTTKYLAAAVLATDAQGFRLLYNSMAPETREVGIVPWDLEPAGTYMLRYGPDADEDEAMDSAVEEREFVFPQAGTPIKIRVEPRVTYVVEVDQVKRGRRAGLAPDAGLSAGDIKFNAERNLLLVKVHNVGSKPVRNVHVAVYDGDPNAGGSEIGTTVIPHIDAPIDLRPRTTTVGFGWNPGNESHEIYVVIDREDEITDELTTFNNAAHTTLPEKKAKVELKKPVSTGSFSRGRR